MKTLIHSFRVRERVDTSVALEHLFASWQFTYVPVVPIRRDGIDCDVDGELAARFLLRQDPAESLEGSSHALPPGHQDEGADHRQHDEVSRGANHSRWGS